ncbi:MAG: type II secretion system F family protein [Bdellovibrionota bacterium]
MKIPLSSELEGNIYIFKTPNGEVGKFKIGSVSLSKDVCTLYLDAVTYSGDQTFVPNSSISIGRARNQWLENRIYLDKEGLNALELRRGNSGCGIVFSKDVVVALYDQQPVIKKYEENNILFYAPLILIFIAIFLIVRVFLEEQDKFKTQEALEEAENAKGKNQHLFIRVTRPFYKRYFVPLVQGSKNKQALRTKYRQKLANAGLTKEMTPEEFVALKFFMILGGPFVFLAFRWVLEEQWDLSYTLLMAVVGYYYPNLWLSGLISKRKDSILLAMPFIVDMLALSVEAGLDFMAAIQRVIEKAPPSALVEEFESLIRETKIGSSRAEGLRQMGWRVNVIEINSFCATLIAADSVGASIAPLLKQLSSELRVKRSSRAEQLGATAATKILFPMIIFIMPAVIIAIFAPMAMEMLKGNP